MLAELFLGPEFREDWATESNRTEWSGRSNRRAFLESRPEGLQSLSQPREKVLSLKGRLRLARRAVRKFDRLRELIDDSDCISCMSKTFTKQKDIVVLQMVLFRLASRDSQNPPGYRYEVFIDSMLRPRSVGNGLFFEYGLPTLDLPDGRSESVTSLQQEVDLAEQSAGRSYLGWSGDESFVDPSSPRLQAGEVFLDVSGGDVEGGLRPCWKLRLFSDLEFAADLSLRLDFRLSRAVEADRPIGLTLVPMGDSTEVVQSPFSLSRFSYDVSLPALSEFQPGESYTILMRVLNADGRPVSEEEQVRFEWPAVGFSEAAPECRGGDIDG